MALKLLSLTRGQVDMREHSLIDKFEYINEKKSYRYEFRFYPMFQALEVRAFLYGTWKVSVEIYRTDSGNIDWESGRTFGITKITKDAENYANRLFKARAFW